MLLVAMSASYTFSVYVIAVYHHYASKLRLFVAVHEDAQRSVANAIEEAAGGLADPWESLEVGCRAFLEASVADDACRIVLVDGPAVLGWPAWEEVDRRNSGRHLDTVLAGLARTGVIDVPSVPAVAALISGALNAAAMRIAVLPDRAAAVEETWASLRPMLTALRA